MAKKGKGKKRQAPAVVGLEGGRCEIECIDSCLRKVDGAWVKVLARINRRRNSFRMYGFFGCTGVVSLLIFVFSLVVYIVIWNGYHSVNEDCLTSTPITSNTDLMDRTLAAKASLGCLDTSGAQEVVGAACDLQDMQSLLNIALASGITMCVQSLCCLILACAFRMFTNLPAEALQHGKTNWLSKCLGGICKLLPWLNRLCHLSQFIILCILWLLIVMSFCLGDFAKTWNCRNYFSNCAFNKLKNCRYYYKVCSPDETLYLNCYVDTERAAFSGRVDVRMLTHDSCIRCEILKADLSLVAEDDEFFFLDESDRGSENWNCKSDAVNCFSSRVFSNIACNCADAAAEILDSAKLASLAGNCGRRRLTNESDGPRPCWQGNYSACGYANAHQGKLTDKSKSHRIHARSFLEDWEVATASRKLQNDTVAENTATENVTLTQGEPISAQQCSWGPSSPEDYFFGAEDCDQHGSTLYRLTVMYCYLTACFWLGMSGVGSLVAFAARPEPWFFQPASPQEGYIWKFCRLCGP